MNVMVLNGSPKGKNSVTLQTALYLEKRNPQLSFQYFHVAQQIRKLEKDMSSIKTALEEADIILFLYPVYTFLVPYQLLRFLELMKEEGLDLKDKFVSQISTSKHFFDTTAHKFLQKNIGDLSGLYVAGLSADMEDLLEEKGRREADSWFDKFLFDCEIGNFLPHTKVESSQDEIFQGTGTSVPKKSDKKVVVVTSCHKDDLNLQNMIAEFVARCPHQVEVKNLREFSFQGGCLGCMQCTVTADCIYSDGFQDYLREDIQKSDATIYAFTIENHYTHSSMKCFDDRQFCNGHRSVTHGMPVGYIISGNYAQEENLQVLVEGRSEVGLVYLAGVATDQGNTAENIDLLAQSLDYALCHKMEKPINFYGVGGTKIFRDMVFLMQGLMKADHKYYKEHGIYDFPQNQKMKIFQMKMIGSLMNMPKAQEKMKGKMSQYILMPYEKVMAETKPKEKNKQKTGEGA
ncbi:MAG: NAD(P)H-dependent oxidoreductase [Eubacteriales bacterium]